MSNQKISEMTAGGAVQAGDLTVAARAGTNVSIELGTMTTQDADAVSVTGGTVQALVNEIYGTTIPSAATIDLTTATGNTVTVSGTTTITAITLGAGMRRTVIFSGILTLTNGANLQLPKGGLDITTAVGDVAEFVGNSAGTGVICTSYTALAGVDAAGAAAAAEAASLSLASGGTVSGDIDLSAAVINEAEGVAVASASTIDLDTATGNFLHITGTTTITAVTLTTGNRDVVFDGILTLTNGASLILPTGANITTAAGDTATFQAEGAGVVRCTEYLRANGEALASVLPVPVVQSKAVSYQILSTDNAVYSTTASLTFNLPLASAAVAGRDYTIINAIGGTLTTVSVASGDTATIVAPAALLTLGSIAMATAGSSATVQTNGTDWYVTASTTV